MKTNYTLNNIYIYVELNYEYILNIFTLANIWGKSKDKISKYRFDLTMFVCHKRDNYISCLWDYNILAISNAPLNMMDAELGCTTTSIFIKISQKALSESLKISLALFVWNIIHSQGIIILDIWYSLEYRNLFWIKTTRCT